MNDKLLFYVDGWFVHFALANKLQEKLDTQFFAIIDVDEKARKFYEEQNLVKFQNQWFYKDSIEDFTKNPDIEYLQSIEQKYGINLWNIAYTDRSFYQYNPRYQFSENEILSILEQEIRFFEKILDKASPDYFLTYMTLTHHHHLLYELCKARGIKSLMLGPVKFANRFMISEDGLHLDDLNVEKTSDIKSREELFEYLDKFSSFNRIKKIKAKSFQENKWARYKANLEFFFSTDSSNFETRYSNFGKTKSKILKEKIQRSVRRKLRKSFIDKNFSTDVTNQKPYVYFPLHYEPERILLVTAQYYDNQLSVISNIAKSLPAGYKLLVKEHPMMSTIGWREIDFYKKILNLPNVKLIHPSINPKEILKNSSLVVTIAGTAGQEAAFYGIPSILFSDQIYSNIPTVKRINSFENLSKIIREQLNHKISVNEVSDFVNLVNQNSFTFEINDIGTDFAYRFGFKGPIMDQFLPNNEIKNFLTTHDESFDLLANEYIKKINHHKKSISSTKKSSVKK